MSARHSPTPFRRHDNAIYDATGRLVCGTSMGTVEPDEAMANAAFVLRACNAHADLVAALRDALPFVEDHGTRTKHRKGIGRDALRAVRAALAKAEEQP